MRYFEPEMNISVFDTEDIVTASGETTSALQNVVNKNDYITTESYNNLFNE